MIGVCLGYENFTSKNGVPCQHSYWAVQFPSGARGAVGMKSADYFTAVQYPLTVNAQFDLSLGVNYRNQLALEGVRLVQKGGES